MLLTTTNTIEGKEITQYFGIVSGETIIGANAVSYTHLTLPTILRV